MLHEIPLSPAIVRTPLRPFLNPGGFHQHMQMRVQWPVARERVRGGEICFQLSFKYNV